MKLVVIGGNAAGMSAASRVKRKDPSWDVVVLEKTSEVSYGACGLPYYVAGLNNNIDLIRIRSAEQFKDSGINVRLGCTVYNVDFESKAVFYTDPSGKECTEQYDKLMISSGSSPKVPPIPGINKKGIYVLKTLNNAEALKLAILNKPKSVAIIGGGYIGLELAEACIIQKIPEIHIFEAADRLLNVFDKEFGDAVYNELVKHNVDVHLGEGVKSFEGTDDKVSKIVTDKGEYSADLVILSIGITPNTNFVNKKLDMFPNGALLTDESMQTSMPDVYAGGDCSTVWHKILDKPTYIALGTYANKQGRLAGDSILGKHTSFKRALGTSMLRCMGIELAKTGLGEFECISNNIEYKTKTVETKSHARYYPDPCILTIKLCYRKSDNVIIGAQIMGLNQAACHIDTLACAIDNEMTTEELGFLDMGYAPPFATVWNAVQIAANAAK